MKAVFSKTIPLLLIILCSSFSLSAVQPQKSVTQPNWTIKILPGYEHTPEQGIDSEPGNITKVNGLKITYDIGDLAGQHVIPGQKPLYLWYREQTLNGQLVRIAFTKKRELMATFPDSSANFWCQIRNEEELADALLIILSYQRTVKK